MTDIKLDIEAAGTKPFAGVGGAKHLATSEHLIPKLTKEDWEPEVVTGADALNI